MLGRRSFYAKRYVFLRKTACAALSGAAAPALHLLSAPADAAPNWRGLVGCIKPTVDNSSLVEKIRLLPPGIGVVPVFLNLTEAAARKCETVPITRRTSPILHRCIATRSVS